MNKADLNEAQRKAYDAAEEYLRGKGQTPEEWEIIELANRMLTVFQSQVITDHLEVRTARVPASNERTRN